MNQERKAAFIRRVLLLKRDLTTGEGQIGFIESMITKALWAGTFLKVFGLDKYWWIILLIGIARIIFLTWFGHTYIKKGIAKTENQLNNELTPQFNETYGMVKELYEKQNKK